MSRLWTEPETPNSAVIRAAETKHLVGMYVLGFIVALAMLLLILVPIDNATGPSVASMLRDLGDYGQFTVSPLQEGLYEVSVLSRFDGNASSYWGDSVEDAIANAAAGEGYRVRLKGWR